MKKWSSVEKLVFRFCFLYFLVYIFFTPNNELPLINSLYEWLNEQLHHFIPWFANSFFGYKQPITIFTNGSGDTTYDYMLWFFGIVITIAGTVNQVACALLGVDVNVGIIPMGSGNGLAFAAKIPKQLNKALDVIFKGNAVYIDSFYINKKFSCMLCGVGFDAQVAHDFALQKKRGLLTYVKQSTRNFIKAAPYTFTLSVNGDLINTEAFFISIANSNQFGNNFTIAPQASLHDGLLDIVIVNKMSKLRMLWNVLKQIRSGEVRPYEDKKYHRTDIGYFQTKKLSIQNPGQAPLHIDGDPATTATLFEIEIIEKAFRLLMPE